MFQHKIQVPPVTPKAVRQSELMMGLPIALLAGLSLSVGPTTYGARMTQFGTKLFSAIGSSEGKNDLVSPLSVYDCLGLLAPAVSGSTESALLTGLIYAPNESAAFISDFHDHCVSMSRPHSGVLMANAVWTRPGLALSSAYQTTISNSFMASATPLVGLGAQGASQINQWVEQNTKGRISSLFSGLPASTSIILTNAIAFDGTWVKAFDERRTQPQTFHGEGGDTKAPMMCRTGIIRYATSDHSEVAVLPYKEGESMWIGLPTAGNGPADAMGDLTAAPQTSSQNVDLQLPKFTYSCTYSLNAALKKIGFASLFAAADFSRMTVGSAPDRISEVIQKTYIKVDEKGTQAAAVTGIVMPTAVMRPPASPIPFHVDRPFAFAIKDDQTGAVLFMGGVRKI
jgi:serine protease inhibitor